MTRRKRLVCFIVLVILISIMGIGIAQAQQKTLFWERFDVEITVLPNGDMLVRETQEISFTSGTFTTGFRGIPLDRVESISQVQVWEGGTAYSESRSEQPDTFYYLVENNELFIEWFFSPTRDTNRTWTVQYLVKGGLRIYEGGDQVFWAAIYPDRDQSVRNAQVTVNLPAATSLDQIVAAAYWIDTSGAATSAEPDVTWQQLDPQTIVFDAASNIRPKRGLEVRVQFPHGIVSASPASWQAAEDRRVAYEEQWKSVVDLVILVGSAFLLIAGVVGVYVLWYFRGRDKPVELFAEYMTEPPADLSPGVAGTLVDQKADMADVVATIVDLARRDIISMEEIEEPGTLGIGRRKDFRYRLLQPDAELLPFEQKLVQSVFLGGQERRLSDLRNKFYTSIPEIRNKLYDEVVKQGFFRASPEKTRSLYAGIGIGGLILTACIGFFLYGMLEQYTSFAFCPPLGIGVAFIGLLIASGYMPSRTQKGSEENARWQAFKRYLQKIETYENVKEATDLFDRYLPYAIAFGLEKDYIRTFADAGTPAPRWFTPYPPIIPSPQGRSTPTRSPGGGVDFGGTGMPREAGAPSLDSMSSGAFNSLSAMSGGLFSMLDSASSTLSSAPKSSGGGGFSGGGRGGGGGGGGGRGGFR